ncbi:MAG: glycoside hydrolase family 2 TIM barrel-domain containing protein [Bryobacterales bacterium]|nr:glycoside hydrolase family 2 TIM barrel-domain containing protein [Bryobacterales bacterium]
MLRRTVLATSLSLCSMVFCLAAQSPSGPSLASPYYVFPRESAQHIALNSWELTHRDAPVKSTLELLNNSRWIRVIEPGSIHRSLFRAGELPDPYVGLNSEKYRWVEEKAWYYRSLFTLPASVSGNRLMLCFDGIDYFAKVWVNGKLAGEHEGMLGGPYIEATSLFEAGRQNEVIVEVRAANWGRRATYEPRNPGSVVKPWVLGGGSGAEMFFTLGMWRGARIEVVPSVHMERPFLLTLTASPAEARMRLDVEIAANPGKAAYKLYESSSVRMREFLDTAETSKGEEQAEVRIKMYPEGRPSEVLVDSIPVELWNGRTRVQRDLALRRPRLWWPNGMGDAALYTVELELMQGGKRLDLIQFTHGIRHLETVPSAGPSTQDVWENWQFRVNGAPFFVKGINWMPADLLLDLPASRYEWLIEMAKAAGIQMFRVWGGGIVETDTFYELCDKHGILVWQDFPLSNMQVPDWPHSVWEAQVAASVYRLRNHPSLAVWCGGNEANPYVEGNTAAIGIFERWVRQLDGTRAVRRSSPDGGSVHEYPDMDPMWYGKRYQLAPFMTETGMHNVPNATTLREVVNEAEFVQPLRDLYNPDLGKQRPELRHHFVEFAPARVPRMLSRASHIDDMRAPSLESLAEASQVGAGEFYQVLSERMQAQYPITTGLLPWVYKRPWPVVAIQTVDGLGHPTEPYYFLKRTYERTHVAMQLPWLLWAPGETLPLDIDVMHAGDAALPQGVIHARVLGAAFEVLHEAKGSVSLPAGASVQRFALGNWTIPEGLAGKYFFLVAELRDAAGKLISRSTYWPRCPQAMADQKAREEWRNQPSPWPTLEAGPWLKPQTAQARTKLSASIVRRANPAKDRGVYVVKVQNTGTLPAFHTSLEIAGRKHSFYATDNFFWLAPGESREIELQVLWRETGGQATLRVQAWNAEAATLR